RSAMERTRHPETFESHHCRPAVVSPGIQHWGVDGVCRSSAGSGSGEIREQESERLRRDLHPTGANEALHRRNRGGRGTVKADKPQTAVRGLSLIGGVCRSVVQDELIAVEKRPEHILEERHFVVSRGKSCRGAFPLGLRAFPLRWSRWRAKLDLCTAATN